VISIDRDTAVHALDLTAGDLVLVGGQVQRHVGDVDRLAWAEQVRSRQLAHRVAENARGIELLLHSGREGHRGRDGVHPDLMRRVFHCHRTGHGGYGPLGSRVAVPSRHRHQRHVRGHIDHRTTPGLDDFGYSAIAAKESAEYINCHTAPEFRARCFRYRSNGISRASYIVVQNMQPA
jgi:hypothetical protein